MVTQAGPAAPTTMEHPRYVGGRARRMSDLAPLIDGGESAVQSCSVTQALDSGDHRHDHPLPAVRGAQAAGTVGWAACTGPPMHPLPPERLAIIL